MQGPRLYGYGHRNHRTQHKRTDSSREALRWVRGCPKSLFDLESVIDKSALRAVDRRCQQRGPLRDNLLAWKLNNPFRRFGLRWSALRVTI